MQIIKTTPIFLRLPYDLDYYVRKQATKQNKSVQQVIKSMITKEMIAKGK